LPRTSSASIESFTKLIVIASKNQGKLKEFRYLFNQSASRVELITVDQFPEMPDVVEDADTFQGNAEKKALEIGQSLNLTTFADDSGLEVDALGGAPGVYSARYAGEHGNDQANNEKLLANLTQLGLSESPARFVSVVSLFIPKDIALQLPEDLKANYLATNGPQQSSVTDRGDLILSEVGYLNGNITFAARGDHGFGYDPIFEVGAEALALINRAGEKVTLAQLPIEQKSIISHRANALSKFNQRHRLLLDALY
jgi:XTP/dITP diphosphohydrolase